MDGPGALGPRPFSGPLLPPVHALQRAQHPGGSDPDPATLGATPPRLHHLAKIAFPCEDHGTYGVGKQVRWHHLSIYLAGGGDTCGGNTREHMAILRSRHQHVQAVRPARAD